MNGRQICCQPASSDAKRKQSAAHEVSEIREKRKQDKSDAEKIAITDIHLSMNGRQICCQPASSDANRKSAAENSNHRHSLVNEWKTNLLSNSFK